VVLKNDPPDYLGFPRRAPWALVIRRGPFDTLYYSFHKIPPGPRVKKVYCAFIAPVLRAPEAPWKGRRGRPLELGGNDAFWVLGSACTRVDAAGLDGAHAQPFPTDRSKPENSYREV
jgi:hypothetical protein